jgi:guanylate kinase
LSKEKLFIISGPSGVGKTTLTEQVIQYLKNEIKLSRIITFTTRPPRKNEVNGKDYFFISPEEFKEKEKSGFFLETARYSGFWYASPIPNEKLFKNPTSYSYLMLLDIQGAKTAIEKINNAIFVWIDPPNIQTLRKRLEERGTENKKDLEKRMATAAEEIKKAYESNIFNYFVINKDFEKAVKELVIIIESETTK